MNNRRIILEFLENSSSFFGGSVEIFSKEIASFVGQIRGRPGKSGLKGSQVSGNEIDDRGGECQTGRKNRRHLTVCGEDLSCLKRGDQGGAGGQYRYRKAQPELVAAVIGRIFANVDELAKILLIDLVEIVVTGRIQWRYRVADCFFAKADDAHDK